MVINNYSYASHSNQFIYSKLCICVLKVSPWLWNDREFSLGTNLKEGLVHYKLFQRRVLLCLIVYRIQGFQGNCAPVFLKKITNLFARNYDKIKCMYIFFWSNGHEYVGGECFNACKFQCPMTQLGIFIRKFDPPSCTMLYVVNMLSIKLMWLPSWISNLPPRWVWYCSTNCVQQLHYQLLNYVIYLLQTWGLNLSDMKINNIPTCDLPWLLYMALKHAGEVLGNCHASNTCRHESVIFNWKMRTNFLMGWCCGGNDSTLRGSDPGAHI
jgi:hypothetical protein